MEVSVVDEIKRDLLGVQAKLNSRIGQEQKTRKTHIDALEKELKEKFSQLEKKIKSEIVVEQKRRKKLAEKLFSYEKTISELFPGVQIPKRIPLELKEPASKDTVKKRNQPPKSAKITVDINKLDKKDLTLDQRFKLVSDSLSEQFNAKINEEVQSRCTQISRCRSQVLMSISQKEKTWKVLLDQERALTMRIEGRFTSFENLLRHLAKKTDESSPKADSVNPKLENRIENLEKALDRHASLVSLPDSVVSYNLIDIDDVETQSKNTDVSSVGDLISLYGSDDEVDLTEGNSADNNRVPLNEYISHVSSMQLIEFKNALVPASSTTDLTEIPPLMSVPTVKPIVQPKAKRPRRKKKASRAPQENDYIENNLKDILKKQQLVSASDCSTNDKDENDDKRITINTGVEELEDESINKAYTTQANQSFLKVIDDKKQFECETEADTVDVLVYDKVDGPTPEPITVKLKDRVLQDSLEWPIRKRKPEATEIIFHSGTFYTGRPGYRVQLRAQVDRLHGDVYFSVRIMQGWFDDQLNWPFPIAFNLCLSKKMANNHNPEQWRIPSTDGWKKRMEKLEAKKDDIFSEWVGPFNISSFIDSKNLIFEISLASSIVKM